MNSGDKKQLVYAIFIPGIIVLVMIISFLFERGMGLDFHSFGILPRNIGNLTGIFTMIFVHGDSNHLFNNSLSLFILGTFLFYFYRQIATKVLIISYICSGLILWVIGRDNWHIGASGLIYAIAFFLFFSGLIRRHIPLIAVSLIVTFVYGSMVWHVFPWQTHDPVSWEGHLAGGLTGSVLAVIFKGEPPQKPIVEWTEDIENEDISDENGYTDNDQSIENQQ